MGKEHRKGSGKNERKVSEKRRAESERNLDRHYTNRNIERGESQISCIFSRFD
jgi:hypothetical protein